MSAENQVLHSKLCFSGSSDTIIRKRLYPLMKEMRNKRLTVIIAGAGYGKSTLIQQAANFLNLPMVYYRLDAYDDDLETFLYYLIAGLRKQFPGLGSKTLAIIAELHDLRHQHQQVAGALLQEIESVLTEDVLVVLDDFHMVNNADSICAFLDFLIENLPMQVHLVISSRIDPNLRLSLHIARRDVVEIKEADLCFSVSEIEQFYAGIFKLQLKNGTPDALYQKTAGWVSALILFYHALRGKTSEELETLLLQLQGSNRIISKYLEENVYDLLSAEFKEFLAKTSILSTLNTQLCDRLLNFDKSELILRRLEEKHLFTHCIDSYGRNYCYHNLFQDFLVNKLWENFSPAEITCLHETAARLLEEMEENEEALKHYLACDQVENACVLLSKLAPILWSTGTQSISSYLKKKTRTCAKDEPWIDYLQALCVEFTGRHKEATRLFEKAYDIFQKREADTGIKLCMAAMGYHLNNCGDIRRAKTILTDLVERVDDNPELGVSSLSHLMMVCAQTGEMKKVETYFQKAFALSLSIKDRRRRASHLAFAYFSKGVCCFYAGEFAEVLKMADAVKAEIRDFRLNAQLAQHHLLIAFACFHLGNFVDGLQHADQGLALLREKRLENQLEYACHDYAWLLTAYAVNSFGAGNVPDALSYCEESLKLFQQSDHHFGQATVYNALFWINSLAGDMAAATESIHACEKVIRGLGMVGEEGKLLCCKILSLFQIGLPEDALAYLAEAEAKLMDSKFETARIAFLYGRYYVMRGQNKTALTKIMKGLVLAEKHQYDFWLLLELYWLTPLLVEVYSKGKLPAYIEKIFQQARETVKPQLLPLAQAKDSKIAKAAAQLLSKLPKSEAPGLRVYCLGRFALFKGDEEISIDKWKGNKKAQMILKYLLTTRARGFKHKDVLMELLWPDEDALKTANRLHVALSALRKILEPELLKGSKSTYILTNADAYKLDLGAGGYCDLDEFKAEMAMARQEKDRPEKAVQHYLKAEALYRGDFLEEDAYVDWCSQERDNYREQYLYALQKIIEFYKDRKDFANSIHYANKYLAVDKYAENIYQSLMSTYSAIGNMAMVTLIFEKCKENIAGELDCPLSEETEKLYKDAIMA